MNEILDTILFSIGGRAFTLIQVILTLVAVSAIFYLYKLGVKFFAPRLASNVEISQVQKTRLWSILRWFFATLVLLSIIVSLKLDRSFAITENFSITIVLVLKALCFWFLARLLDWTINNLFLDYIHHNEESRKAAWRNKEQLKSASKSVQFIFYTIVLIYILRYFELDITFHRTPIDENGGFVSFTLSNTLEAILVILVAQLIIWAVIHFLLFALYKKNTLDEGSQFAINQLVKYVIYIFAITIALEVFGINMTLLLGGAAALLVGVGLGLQQTFNDFISGIVLLFERSVSVGDILEFEGSTVGVVKKIGLRASVVEIRNNMHMVVPNHLLVNERVMNWTQYGNKIRFSIDIGVAYGSDTELVKKLLLESVEDNDDIFNYPEAFVRFQGFGESSLDFTLFFFSSKFMIIEDVKSDLRFKIDALFRENKITIPFPQREIKILNQ